MTEKEKEIIRETTQRKWKIAKLYEKDKCPKYQRMYETYLSEYIALKCLMNKLKIETERSENARCN